MSSDRRELNNGFGEALSRAFEMAVTPALFGGLGFLLDRWLGVIPLFTIIFTLVVVVYFFWKSMKQYSQDMARHEVLRGKSTVSSTK